MTTDDRKQDLIEQVAAALHRDDVEHGRVFVGFDEVDAETKAWYIDNALAVLPLVKRAQAEAWSEGHAHGELYADDPISSQDNPYIENEGERA